MKRLSAVSDGLITEQPDQERHLKMESIGCLQDDLAPRAVEHVGGHLFTAVRGQTVKEDRIGPGVRQQARG